MTILDKLLHPVYNILDRSDALNSPTNFTPAYEANSSLGMFSAAAGKSTCPFIIGFLPPDLIAEFTPVEVAKVVASAAEPPPKTAGGTTQPGTSASPVKHVGGVPSTPGELQRATTTISTRDMKTAVYNELRRRGLSEDRAQFLTPYMCAQIATEIRYEKGQFTTFNFNVGNVHAGAAGTYKDPSGPKDPSNWDKPPVPPKGGTYALGTDTTKGGVAYPTYFRAADSLESGVSAFIGTLAGAYPGTLRATNPTEYVAALRPDNHGGPKNKQYFAVDEAVYERGVRGKLAWFGGKADPTPSSSVVNSGTNANVPLSSLDIRQMAAGSTNINENDPLADKLGRNIRVDAARLDAVQKQNAALNRQISMMEQTPALLMLVNPTEFKKNHEHGRTVQAARRAPQVHVWTENPVRLSCSGRTAAQYAVDGSRAGGLTNTKRIYSLSYQNLMSLFMIYKNNGRIYADESFGEGNAGVAMLSAAVFIYYNGTVYIGSFDNFTIEDTADSVYNMGYSFTFTIRYEVEAQGVSDAEILASLRQVA